MTDALASICQQIGEGPGIVGLSDNGTQRACQRSRQIPCQPTHLPV